MSYSFIVEKDESFLEYFNDKFYMVEKSFSLNEKSEQVILATLDFEIGVLYTNNKVLKNVEIIKNKDGYALKDRDNNKFLCKPPFKENEHTKECFFDRTTANEWENFKLKSASHLETSSKILDILEYLSYNPKTDKHIIIAIRYSLFLEKGALWWQISKEKDQEEYKNMLFDEKRLSSRQQGFLNITLPTLQHINKNKPKNINFKVVILTSEDLPKANKLFLSNIKKSNSFIDINYLKPKDILNDYFKYYLDNEIKDGQIYASVRLDDDDGLSVTWLNQMLSYLKPEYSNKLICLSNGVAALLDENANLEKTSPFQWLFGSAGLTYIGKKGKDKSEIYACGNHQIPYQRYETIVYSKGIYFIRAYNGFNDSNVDFPNKNCYTDKEQIDILSKEFGIS